MVSFVGIHFITLQHQHFLYIIFSSRQTLAKASHKKDGKTNEHT